MFKVHSDWFERSDPLREIRENAYTKDDMHVMQHIAEFSHIRYMITDILKKREVYEMSLYTRDALHEVRKYCDRYEDGAKNQILGKELKSTGFFDEINKRKD